MSLGWIKRIGAGFLLGFMFFLMPFTDIGKDDPWYFWVGSGLVAFAAGAVLTWLWTEGQKTQRKKRPSSRETTGEEQPQ